MKKKFWILGVIVLVFAVAVAVVGIGAQNAIGDIGDNGGNKTEEEIVEKPVGEEPKDILDIKEAKGILIGRIDSHSVEIEVANKLQAFALSDELRDKEFARGEISFKYYVDKDGRSVITEADFQEPIERDVKTVEGIFSGLADNHTAEIEIQNEPRAFGLDDDITFAGLEEGDEVFIAYYEDDSGRLIIVKVEKIF